MQVISIVNQKGGVGKTTTAINLAGTLAAINYKILLIDFDPQGNCSSGLGFESMNKELNNSYTVVVDNLDINTAITKTRIPNLNILLSNLDLAAAEIELCSFDKREYILKNKLKDIKENFDYILIDCPPSLSMLTINALCASDSIIVPLQCEFFALEGLAHLLDSIERIKENFNKHLTIDGILLTMYDRRNKLTENIEKDVRDCLGDLVYKTVIPRNIRLSEAASHGIPAILYDSNCSGSIAYMSLVEEIIKKSRKK